MRAFAIVWLFCRLSSGKCFRPICNLPFTTSQLCQTKTNDADKERTVTILQRGPNHIIVVKPPSVVCHHSGWTGSRSKQKRGEEPEIPMLQRVRDAVYDIDSAGTDGGHKSTRKVNLVHRLDRGASGALLLAFADDAEDDGKRDDKKGTTTALIEAMASPESIKTYVALVRGEVSNR